MKDLRLFQLDKLVFMFSGETAVMIFDKFDSLLYWEKKMTFSNRKRIKRIKRANLNNFIHFYFSSI